MMLPVAPQVYRVRFEGKPLLEQVSIFLQGPGRGLSVQFSRLVVSDSLQPRELQHAGLPVHHHLPEITQIPAYQLGDAIQPSHPHPFSSCPQSLPASESFPISQRFA